MSMLRANSFFVVVMLCIMLCVVVMLWVLFVMLWVVFCHEPRGLCVVPRQQGSPQKEVRRWRPGCEPFSHAGVGGGSSPPPKAELDDAEGIAAGSGSGAISASTAAYIPAGGTGGHVNTPHSK